MGNSPPQCRNKPSLPPNFWGSQLGRICTNTHLAPKGGALTEDRSDASNTDDEHYDFAEGGFY